MAGQGQGGPGQLGALNAQAPNNGQQMGRPVRPCPLLPWRLRVNLLVEDGYSWADTLGQVFVDLTGVQGTDDYDIDNGTFASAASRPYVLFTGPGTVHFDVSATPASTDWMAVGVQRVHLAPGSQFTTTLKLRPRPTLTVHVKEDITSVVIGNLTMDIERPGNVRVLRAANPQTETLLTPGDTCTVHTIAHATEVWEVVQFASA